MPDEAQKLLDDIYKRMKEIRFHAYRSSMVDIVPLVQATRSVEENVQRLSAVLAK